MKQQTDGRIDVGTDGPKDERMDNQYRQWQTEEQTVIDGRASAEIDGQMDNRCRD